MNLLDSLHIGQYEQNHPEDHDDDLQLVNIIIPNGVTMLSPFCFSSHTSLTNIIIPSTVTTISEQCLFGCKSLTTEMLLKRFEQQYPSNNIN
ncbi:hypothetical protein QTN25_009572 [Entamoeba marina]